MKKRALSLLLVFAMILSFVPTTALAAENGNTEGTEETTNAEMKELQKKIDEVTAGGTVKLDADINATDLSLQISRNVTLDLNGNTITCTSSSKYFPTIYIAGANGEPIEVTITNGSVVGESEKVNSGGIYIAENVRKVTLNDVDITASRSDMGQAWGLTIAHPSDETTTTEVTLDKDCTVAGRGGIAIIPAGTATAPSSTHLVELNVDGNVTSTTTDTGSDCAAISGNGLDLSNPKITISGNVTATGRPTEAIYLPEKSTTIIKSGATVTGLAGIAMKSGTLEIENGATIHAIGPYKNKNELEPRTNGVSADGSAVFIESYEPKYHGAMSVKIGSGAILKSDYSYAIRENREESSNEELQSLIIEDGATLIAGDTKAVTTPILLSEFTENGEAKIPNVQIKGGNYSHPVKYEYLVGGKALAAETDLIWEVKADSGDAPYTYYAKLNTALEAGATSITKREADETDLSVTLKYNDGTDNGQKYDVKYNVKDGKFTIPKEATPTVTGKTFVGWQRNDTKGTIYQPEAEITSIGNDIILTATWTVAGATVKFDFTDVSGVTPNLEPTEEENWIPNLTPAGETGTYTYTIADKTKDVTFKLKDERTNKSMDIAVSYQIGSSTAVELSRDAEGVYTLPASTFTDKVSIVNIKVSEVTKKTVTFDFGKLTGLDVDNQNLENLKKDTEATDAKKYTVEDKTAIAKFKLTGGSNTQKYTVTYKVGETGTEETLEPDTSSVYTLPANLADNVTVTVTAADKNTITFAEIDKSVEAYVEKIERASADSNLTPKDEANKVYVATDDTEPISFVVTAKTDSGNAVKLPENENIVVKYKLAKDEDSAYKPVSAQSVSSDKKTYTCTLNADAITGDIIVKVFLEATPVYTAEPSISGSTSTTTITETEVIANIDAAKAQDEPLTIEAKVGTESVTKSEVELAGNLIQTITSTETKVDLAVTTDVGTVELPSETVSEIVDKNSLTENDPLTVKVEDKKDQIDTITNVVANAISLFDVTLMSGTKEVNAEDLGLKLRITLTFKIEAGLINPKLYRFENGKGIELSDVSYNPKTGEISGKTDHLSEFYAAVAADASISTVLGKSVSTDGTGRLGEPAVVPVQVSSDTTTITANDIIPSDKNATVTLYSDSAFTAEASSITLKDGLNEVYAKVENATDTNGSTAYYKITVDKAAADTDCTLKTVLTKPIQSAGGTGTKEDPYRVNVIAEATTLKVGDIIANSSSAAVKLYSDKAFSTDASTSGVTLASNTPYATVTNGGTTVYYEINVTGDAITPLKLELSTDGTKVNVDPETAATGANRKYAIVTNNPESEIASWNTATTESAAKTALGISDNLGQLSSFTLTNTDNGKYIVVADVKDSKIVAAGSMKIQLPVTVTIDGTGLANGDTLTVARGTAPVGTGDKVPYGTSLNLKLSNAKYVVYATEGNKDKVVPMNETDGTYTVTGNTTFSVEAGYSVTIKDDSNAKPEVMYNMSGADDDDVYLSKGVTMVPSGAELAITWDRSKYILMVDGVEKTDTNPVMVTKDTTIEVVPGYTVTITSGGSSAPQVQVMVDGKAITGGELFPKDTELTIIFVDATGNYKVQVDGHTLPFSTSNATISYTVTANTEIKVVSSDTPDKIEELTVMVDPTGNPSVTTKDGEEVTGVTYVVVSGHEDFTDWKNDKTEAAALTELNGTVITDLPLTTANNNQHLVALQISGGNVIAAGCSDPIKVSSPTTPTTGYTVSGTVEKGNTTVETVDGIIVTLTDGSVTYTTTVKDGKYEFNNVASGNYTLEIAPSADYNAVSKSIEVKAETVLEVITLTKLALDPDGLTMTGTKIEGSDQTNYTVNGVVKGMYYTVTLSETLSIPFFYSVRAESDNLSFTCPDGTIIDILEFAKPISYNENGTVNMESNTGRTADNRDEPVQ